VRGAVVILVAIVVAAVGVVEVAARPLLTSAATQVVPCAEHVQVTAIRRPASLDLLRGEVRDVRLELDGVATSTLRLERVRVAVPRVPVLAREVDPMQLDVDATISAADLEWFVAERAPELVRPTVAVVESGVVLSDERLPVAVELEVGVADGRLRLTPQVGDASLWSALGIELQLPMPDGLEVRSVVARAGALEVSATAFVPHPAAIAGLCR
jgi:hypothetical protein